MTFTPSARDGGSPVAPQCCDRIVVLEQGHVAGVGTWDALMTQNVAFQARIEVA